MNVEYFIANNRNVMNFMANKGTMHADMHKLYIMSIISHTSYDGIVMNALVPEKSACCILHAVHIMYSSCTCLSETIGII